MTTVTVGQNSYVDESALQAYADLRGIPIAGDNTALLIQAMDYIEIQPFTGAKTSDGQPLQFPRDGSATVPTGVQQAQIVAALEIDRGVNLLAPISRTVKREKVDTIEVEYTDTLGSAQTDYLPPSVNPQLQALLKAFVKPVSTGFGMMLTIGVCE